MRKRIDVLWEAGTRDGERAGARAWLLEAAGLCLDLGLSDRAALIFERIVHDDPFDFDAWRGLQSTSTDAPSRQRLRDRLQAAIEAVHISPSKTRLRLLHANSLLAEPEGMSEAVTALSVAVDEDPADGEASRLLWEVLERGRRQEDLVAALERRLDRLTSASDAHAIIDTRLRLGRALEQADRSDEARIAYESLVAFDGQSLLEETIVLALEDLDVTARAGESSRRDELVEFLRGAIERVSPPGAESLTLRFADALSRANRHEDAERQLESLLARNPHHGEALRALSDLMAARGDWAAATDIRRRLLVDVLDRGGSKGELVQVALSTAEAAGNCNRLEHVRKAVSSALDVLAKRPLFVPELVSLCEAIGAWSRLAEVLEAEALRRGDVADKVRFLLQAATTWLEHGDNASNALRVAAVASALQPESIDTAMIFAKASLAVGQTDEAIVALRRAAQRARGQRSAVAAIHLEIGKAYLSGDQLLEAAEALREAFASDWRTGDVALLLGLVSIDLGDEKTAERALTAVTTLPVHDGHAKAAYNKATGFYHLAAMALAKGDFVKAKLLAAKAIEVGDHPDARRLLKQLADARAASPSV
jgi:tetratricopeptide (TPR) repeat protein